MHERDLFIDTVTSSGGLPAQLAAGAANVQACEGTTFDQTYVDFLDTQIRLAARGPEWTERLKRRREGLRPHCGVLLVFGRVRTAVADYTVYVDPARRVVVYWEEYRREDGAP